MISGIIHHATAVELGDRSGIVLGEKTWEIALDKKVKGDKLDFYGEVA